MAARASTRRMRRSDVYLGNWGTRIQDALPFMHRATAEIIAEEIGHCEIVYEECAE